MDVNSVFMSINTCERIDLNEFSDGLGMKQFCVLSGVGCKGT